MSYEFIQYIVINGAVEMLAHRAPLWDFRETTCIRDYLALKPCNSKYGPQISSTGST